KFGPRNLLPHSRRVGRLGRISTLRVSFLPVDHSAVTETRTACTKPKAPEKTGALQKLRPFRTPLSLAQLLGVQSDAASGDLVGPEAGSAAADISARASARSGAASNASRSGRKAMMLSGGRTNSAE